MSLFPSHGGACQELSHVPIEPWWETNPATTPRQEFGMVSPELPWLVAALAGGLGLRELSARMSRIPRPITTQEADAIWYWIRQVGPEEGILAAYEVTAPLSSRKRLFSYVLEQNKPRGFPRLGPEFQWVFLRDKALDFRVFLDQGFDVIYKGDFLTV